MSREEILVVAVTSPAPGVLELGSQGPSGPPGPPGPRGPAGRDGEDSDSALQLDLDLSLIYRSAKL